MWCSSMGMALPCLCCSYQVENRFGRVLPSHLFCFYLFCHSLFFPSSCFLVSLSLFSTSLLFTIFLPLNVFPLETELKSYLFTGARLSEKCALCCVESRLEALMMDIRRRVFLKLCWAANPHPGLSCQMQSLCPCNYIWNHLITS